MGSKGSGIGDRGSVSNPRSPIPDPPKISINAHLLSGEAGYRRAGIHQYIYQVLRHLPRDAFEYQVHTRFEGLDGLQLLGTAVPTERRLARIVWEQMVWPWHILRQRPALLHGMAFATPLFTAVPSVVTVYDLSFLHFPERFPKLQQKYLAAQTRLACRRARRVITISESTRQDVHTFLGVPLSRIDVVVPGLDSAYRPQDEAAVARFKAEKGINGRFILHVGTLQPRKNIETLIEAFAQLDDDAIQLVLVGGKGWLFNDIFARVQQHRLEERIIFTGYVPDEELPLWYAAADLFVFPSVYEGFGMPVVEAMACGTPVIAANSSSIPEAAGDAGMLFDPFSPLDLTERMENVLHNPQLSDKMRQLGITQARQFSWERAGRETAVVYHNALKK